MEAMLEAKKAGRFANIGFTGHKDPSIHLKTLNSPKRIRFASMRFKCL
jgi:hypothetical protein